jgi:hypothetical protein
MKRPRDLFLFLILEVLSVLVAAGAFALIPSKIVAAGVAGGYFFLFSAFMLFRMLRWPKWWEAWTFYPTAIFLFGCSIPMLWERFTHLEMEFKELRILGIPGPEFHQMATSMLGLLFLVTLAEAAHTVMRVKPKTNRG